MKVCALFPGQGFQRFGMLSRLAQTYPNIVQPILEECDTSLPGLRLSELLLGSGPEVDTTPTELAQPLLLVQGYAHYKVWQTLSKQNVPKFGMGHSLGEYTAFTAAQILDYKDALKLVRARGECMRDATRFSKINSQESLQTGMALAVKPRGYKSSWPDLLATCAKQSTVDVAAFNSSSQIVISGKKEDLKTCLSLVEEKVSGRIISKLLPVSSAFHSKYMQPAASQLNNLIDQVNWNFEDRQFDVISNLSGKPYASVDEIKRSCVAALTNPVQWLQSSQYADYNGADEFVAFGGEIGKLMEKEVNAKTSTFI